jgi:hypothetical protein
VKSLLPIIVIIAALVIGGLFLSQRGKQEVSVPSEVGEEVPAEKEGEAFTGKLKELLGLGQALKCTWQHEGSSGTGYIKANQYYGEIISEGGEGYVIIKNNCMWTWSKEEKQGVKMCFEPEKGEEGDLLDTEGSPQGDFTCVPAIVSDAQFNPPTDISFIDIDQMLKMGE